MEAKEWDIFVSHAAEDKATVARPLAAALRRAGARVWLDEQELTIGDSLSEKIDEGLAHSQFGVVILSPAFFAKHWPRRELAGLRSREEQGEKVILPVWHNVDKATISQFSPILADALAANTEQGIDNVAMKLLDVIFPAVEDGVSREHRSVGRRLIEILRSSPDKEALTEFLQFHVSRGDFLHLGGEPMIEKYQLYDVGFDAYSSYVGHGMRLTLVNFTEVWADPFETDRKGAPKIHEKISSTISGIESIQHRFSHDLQSQARVSNWLGRNSWLSRHLADDPEYFDSWVPELDFIVFAGRRSEIDASPARHNIWSQLRNYRNDISIRTYDSLIDAFL
jgi:hypothetical protein